MTFIKLIKNQDFNAEIYIRLKNNKSSIIFASKNSLLLNYYQCDSNKNDHDLLIILGNLFSHELVKFFGTKIEGGVFEVLEVTSNITIDKNLSFVDIIIEENAHAKIYGTKEEIDSINKLILDKTILKQINKLTGFPVMINELKIDEIYNASLLDNVRILQNRFQFLKCSYDIENTVFDFYFPEKIVRYFSSLVIKNVNLETIPFNALLGKIFSELFLNYLSKNAHVFVKTKSVELVFVKDKEFLEFNLNSVTNQFEFFTDVKHKLFFIKLLTSMNFKQKSNSSSSLPQGDNERPKLDHLNFPFSVELGVTYLNQSEYKNLTEGDILVFDKTCLSTDTMSVDQCVINLNGLNMVASLHEDSCQVTHFTKDW